MVFFLSGHGFILLCCCKVHHPTPDGFNIAAALPINVPGMDTAAVQALLEKTHKICPYSNATRGHIDVTLTVIYILRAEKNG
jgi:organic hydroperoxide reductase OsmC/OhrA